jgi:hypothetical protein
MEETKKWYASKGIWGALMAGVAAIWNLFEGIHMFVDMHPDLEKGVGTFIQAVASDPSALVIIVGAFFAWLGRWKAKDKISNDIY